MHHAAKIRKHPPPRSPARSTLRSTTTIACRSSVGSRPDHLYEVRPQERVPRHILEQIVDSAPVLPLLHAPVPQTVDSVGEVLKILDNLVPDVEQVIDVPMIFAEDFQIRTFRSSLLEPQTAELLVELPEFDYVGLRRYEGWAQVTSLRPCPTSSSSLRRTVDGASLQLIDRGGYCRYATETGTHRGKLCFFGLVLTCPLLCMSRSLTTLTWCRVQQTTEIHQVQTIDKVFDFPLVQVQQILGCRP